MFFIYKIFASEQSLWQQDSLNGGVRLPNFYTHARLAKVLPITSKDIHYFITLFVININFTYFENLNISTTKQDSEKLKILFSLIWKCCSVTSKIGSTNFSLQWCFKACQVYTMYNWLNSMLGMAKYYISIHHCNISLIL